MFISALSEYHMGVVITSHRYNRYMYACLNYDEAFAPDEIRKRSVCISGDIGEILFQL